MPWIACCFALSFFAPLYSQSWSLLAPFPGVERDDAVGFMLGTDVYVGSGLSPWWASQGDFYRMNGSNGQWESVAPMPPGMERQYASAFVIQNQAFVFGGYNAGTYLNDLWRYDPGLNLWTACNNLPSAGRSGAACFVLEGKAYLIGGKQANTAATDEVWQYDPQNDTWTPQTPFPGGKVWRSSAIAHHGNGYLLFGRNENNAFLNAFFTYNPLLNQWVALSSFPALGRSHSGLFALYDGVYACFGIDSLNQSMNDLWKYDSISTSWIPCPGIPALGRRGGVCLSDDQHMYYLTGIDETNQRLQEVWQFAPFVGLTPTPEITKGVIEMLDALGRKVPPAANQLQIERFSDGSHRKVFRIEP
jgi:N-acetylneuraminic acid mutarotase